MWIREKFKALLSIKDRPHHVAMSFSVGVFIGVSPLLGLHTILGLMVSYLFRLNKFVTIMGVYVTNPWTIIPIYTFGTWSGMKLLGTSGSLSDIQWKALTLSNVVHELEVLLWPFVIGTFSIAVLSAGISYLLIFVFLKRRNG